MVQDAILFDTGLEGMGPWRNQNLVKKAHAQISFTSGAPFLVHS